MARTEAKIVPWKEAESDKGPRRREEKGRKRGYFSLLLILLFCIIFCCHFWVCESRAVGIRYLSLSDLLKLCVNRLNAALQGEMNNSNNGLRQPWCLHQRVCLEGAGGRLGINKQRVHVQIWVT